MASLVSASQVVTGQVQSLDSVRAHALPSDAVIFASATKVQPVNQNPGSYGLVESANALTLTTTGSVPVVTQSPFADLYKEGSIYFNGTAGNYASATATGLAATQWNTTGMTFECWVNYPTFTGASQTAGTTPTAQQIPGLFGIIQAPTGGGINWSFGANTTGYVTLFYGGAGNQTVMAQTPISANTWNHIAVSVAPAGFIYIFINGVQSQVVANRNGTLQAAAYYETVQGTPVTTSYPLVIGQYASTAVNAYVADLRITTGAGLYTGSTSSYATFTVPSAPLNPASSGVTQALIRAGQNAPTIQSGALTFDRGLKQYMNFGPQTFNIATRGFTAMFKYTWNGTATNYERIFQACLSKSDQNNSLHITRLGTGSQLTFQWVLAGAYATAVNSASGLAQGTTYIAALVYNPTVGSGTAQWWINGAPSGTAVSGLVSAISTDLLTPFTFMGVDYLGGSSTAVAQCGNFSANTFAVYNRALSNTEIYNAYLALSATPQQVLNTVAEIGDINGSPALSIAGDGRVNVTKLGQTSNVLPWPPAAMTGYDTVINGQVYKARASTESVAAQGAWYAFDKISTTTESKWASSGPVYSTTAPYGYTGTVTTTDTQGTVYPGEWLQIQLPSPVILSSYIIYAAGSSTVSAGQMPSKWVVLGSRDGVSWSLVDSRSGVTSWVALTGITFTMTATQTYNYYRIVGNQMTTGSTGYLSINEWTLYGTTDTAQTLTVAQPVTLSYGAQTASLTGISGDKYVPQDFSSSGLNIPAYITTSNASSASNVIVPSSFGPFTGQGSLYYPGGSAPPTLKMPYTTAPSLNFNPFTGDFTAEAWVYNTVATTYNTIVGNYPEDWAFKIVSDRTVQFYDYNTGAALGFNLTGGTVPLNTWTHVAVTYSSSGTTARIFVNGTLATSTGTYTGTPRFTSTQLEVGSFNNGSHLFNGYIGEVRIVRGAALYTTTFTPPTGPLQPVQGTTQSGTPYGTVLLLRNAPAPGRVLTTKFSGGNSANSLSFPPAAMTTYATTLNSGYGQGTYVASVSSEYSGAGWTVFDKNTTNYWQASSTGYSSGAPYTGTVSTTDVNGNSYSGDWVQIQLPTAITLSSYTLSTEGTANWVKKWFIMGSRDGTNWNLVDQQTYSSWAVASSASATFTVNSARSFTFYRFIENINGNTGSGGFAPAIKELVLNGTIEGPSISPDGRLGVGVSAPVQALEVAGSAVVGGTVSAGNPLTFKNRVINGDMRIAQRGVTLTTGTGTAGPYLLDRFYTSYNITTGGLTQNQNALSITDPPYQQGLRYAMNLVATTACTNYAYISPLQPFEGFSIQDFNWGTSFGSPVTISLWFKTNAAAGSTFSVTLRNYGSGPSTSYWCYNDRITTGGVNTWQYFTFQVPPPPSSSTWFTGSAGSAELFIGGYTNGMAAAPGWVNNNNIGLTGQTNWPSTLNNYIAFTGVQLEKGTVATPFEFRPFGVELQLCQRYYEQSYSQGTVAGTSTSTGSFVCVQASNGANDVTNTIKYCVPKRTTVTPTIYTITGTSGSMNYYKSGASTTNTAFIVGQSEFSFAAYCDIGVAWTPVEIQFQWVANAEL